MADQLKSILERVDDWLKFAEAKNATLIVIDSAIAFAALDRLASDPAPACVLRLYLAIAALALGFAVLLSLISFLPRTRVADLVERRSPRQDDNLLLYEHIAGYAPGSYLAGLRTRTGEKSPPTDPLDSDYAAQIVANSRITVRKNLLFTAAVWATITALFTPIVAFPLYLWIRPRQVVT